MVSSWKESIIEEISSKL